MTRPHLQFLLRGLLSAVFLAALTRKVNWPEVASLLPSLSVGWLLAHLATLLGERALFAFKWGVLLAPKGFSVPFKRLLSITLVGKFWAMFLPSSVGVDVLRSYYLYRTTADGIESVSSVFVDKVLSLLALVIVCLVGLELFDQLDGGDQLTRVLVGILLVASATICAILFSPIAKRVGRYSWSFLGPKISAILQGIYESLVSYRSTPGVVAYGALLSIGFQLVRVLSAYTMARALNVDVDGAFLLVVVPVSMVLIMLPISIGGIGLREGIFVSLLSWAGVPRSQAFALGFSLSITDLLISAVGGVVYLILPPAEKPSRRFEDSPDSPSGH